ncbi:MAG: phosphotransferase [Verrucomicrobiota bacterium]
MAEVEFRQQLLEDGVISSKATLTPLVGGVSSDIFRVDDGDRVFVVKRALAQLKVADEWHADLSRNQFEVAYLNVVGEILPDVVPKVLSHNPDRGYFTMEHLGDGFRNWKTMLLTGECNPEHARRAGQVLGIIHRETSDRDDLREQFDTTDNFHDLRLEPYLLKTAERHPSVDPQLQAEANRIRNTRQCLVHGDYSPKNLLFGEDRFVLLDCEVAWFGDPAFDVAFLLNHLMIKALHVSDECLNLVREAWTAYRAQVENEVGAALPNLLPALMLARIDGKSPVEYLAAEEQVVIRQFATSLLKSPARDLDDLFRHWKCTFSLFQG